MGYSFSAYQIKAKNPVNPVKKLKSPYPIDQKRN
jgi:hypothetical protein